MWGTIVGQQGGANWVGGGVVELEASFSAAPFTYYF